MALQLLSFTRRDESLPISVIIPAPDKIPACAGMTGRRERMTEPAVVIPAKAGIFTEAEAEIPAFAGMTMEVGC